jgi:hypothetical protein
VVTVFHRLGPFTPSIGLSAVVVVVTIAYVITWGPAAARADLLLDRPSALRIILLPLIRILRALIRIRSANWSRDWVLGAAGVFVGSLGLIAALVWISAKVPVIYTIARRLWLFLIVVTVVPVLLPVARNLGRRVQDHRLLRNIDRGDVPHCTFIEMLDLLDAFQTNRALLLFLQDIKRRQIAVDHPAALRALQTFVTLIAAPAHTDTLPPALIARLADTEVEVTENWARRRRLRPQSEFVSQSILDEVGKITADSEISRHTTPPDI